MTEKDSAVEVDFVSTFAVTENFKIQLETGYIKMSLNKSTWGKSAADTSNAWKADVLLSLTF